MENKSPSLSLIILTFAGVLLSALSLYEYAVQASGATGLESFCNINATFNCGAVNASKYSKLFGVPLASYGLAFYLFFFIWNFRAKADEERKEFNSVLFLATVLALIFSLYLFYISKFVIGTVCIFCVGLYLVNALLCLHAYRATYQESGTTALAIQTVFSYPGKLARSFGAQMGTFALYSGVILASFIAPHLFVEYLKSKPTQPQAGELTEWLKKPVTQLSVDYSGGAFSDMVKGPQNAPITIVEFFDYQCGACRVMHEKLVTILAQHKDSIVFVAKNYPLDKSCNTYVQHEMHKHACFAASLARCAGEQGKYWEAHEVLMTLDALDSETPEDVLKRKIWLAFDDLGIDTSAVHDCVESGRQLKKVKAEIEEGNTAQIRGTPSVFINGRYTETPKVESVINALIKQRSNSETVQVRE